MPENKSSKLICLLALLAVTLAVYWPVAHFDFINYDDPDYVVFNPAVRSGLSEAGIVWAFKASYASNWHPLTWISHMADCSLYGLNPGRHHLTNLFLHAENAMLVLLVLRQLTGSLWRSALVAALFAWHPLHVESVAWISERKDVLSTFFWLLTLLAYGKYLLESRLNPRAKTRRWVFYGLTLLCFIGGLLSKPSVVTLPCVLLLWDFWFFKINGSADSTPRPSWARLILEKIPFFILAALDCIATVIAQRGANSIVSAATLSLPDRIGNAIESYVLYIGKIFWPVDLALPYPFSDHRNFSAIAACALVLLLITAVTFWRLRAQPSLFVGWCWFLGTLVPMIGLVQVGTQSMADRYTYIPALGIFIMAAWAIPADWFHWPRPGFISSAIVAAILLFLVAGTEVQLQYWRNSISLFSHTAAVTQNNILAEYNLAEALNQSGDVPRAIEHYERALAMQPNRVEAQYNSQTQAHFNLGVIFLSQKNWVDAEKQLRAFIHDEPKLTRGYTTLGVALIAQNRVAEAIEQFKITAQLEPENAGEVQVLGMLDIAYSQAGRKADAIIAAQKTRAAALAVGRKDLADAAEKRIAGYSSGKF